MAAPALLVFYMSYDWPHDCSNWGVEEISRWLGTNHLSSKEAEHIAANQAITAEQAKKGRLDYIT